MHLPTALSYLSLLATTTTALATAKAKAPFFILAGDSTTAKQSEGGGGWGTGFLTTTLTNGATGTNYGHNGATTVSFRQGGDWATVLSAAKTAASKSYAPYVTIQFGHNDQKPAANISAAQLTTNLVAFVNEVKQVGATPILVTSLSRRKYGSDGKIKLDLADVVAAAKQAASETGADIIDLNAASVKYLNAIGKDKAPTYDLKEGDSTHLNAQGSVVFGNLVAMLIKKEVPAVSSYIKPVKAVQSALEKGVYILPTV
jgi:lysophospholipase L1-like esterase